MTTLLLMKVLLMMALVISAMVMLVMAGMSVKMVLAAVLIILTLRHGSDGDVGEDDIGDGVGSLTVMLMMMILMALMI